MKRVVVAVLGIVLVFALVGPARAADPVQWRIVPGGHPIPNNQWLSLFNMHTRSFLEVGQRSSGVGLRFNNKAPVNWKLATKDTTGVVHYGDALCLREKTVGRSLISEKRKTGIGLAWSHDMVYEWEVRGGTKGEVVGAGSDTTDVSLFNTKTGQYMVYGTQTPGVDLQWQKP